MLRKYFHRFKKPDKDNIKWRSHEPTRIEAFSDAAFAFALSLLVISLEVPKSSKELLEKMEGFAPFAFCFFAVFYIWYEQYKFFRRYGMHDVLTIVLNGFLIFLVLCLVYPLKFLFSLWMIPHEYTFRVEDVIPLIVVYNVAFVCVYATFAGMYYNASAKKEELGLTAVEAFETRTHMYTFLYPVIVGALVVLFALFGGKYGAAAMAGWGLMSGLGILSQRRKKIFQKKFGKVPMVEPHLASE